MSRYSQQKRSKLLFKLKQTLPRFEQQSRVLTKGECVLARSVFGDSLHLQDIRLKTAWWVLKNYAVSPNGHIYFHPSNWISDFSQAPLGKKSWLIHELTHVWQWQQGLKVVRGAVLNRRYRYHLKADKPFFNYGIEQQARMVQDYFIRRQLGQPCQDLAACIPFLAATPRDFSANNNSNSNNSDSAFKL
ncbi:type IV secretion protein Rhs [Psychrobacter sp. AH5]|uniref:type IV secretion protein Rhs n=1 Tax=Psychrobacter sp. AH5 TaxID=2937433 RepID=UPI00333EF67F